MNRESLLHCLATIGSHYSYQTYADCGTAYSFSMKPTRSLRHNASVRSVASTSVSRQHQHSTSGGADKAYDTVLSKAAAKHAFELSMASSSVRENGNTPGGLNRATSTSSGKRQERMALSRGFSTRTESYRRSVQSEAGLARSKTVGPSSKVVPIGGKECSTHRTTLGGTAIARSVSAGASSLVRVRSIQSFQSGGMSRSATMTSRYSTISIGSTPAATRRDSFLRGGDEFAEVEYRNNPRLRKKHEKKLAAAVKKAETEKVERRETGSDRGGNAFIKGVKKMFSFASSNAKNVGAQREVTDEDERGTYTVLTTTSEFTSPRSNVESHTPIPPQQVSSRQAYYRPASQVGYAFSRRASFAQSMSRVHVDDYGGSFEVNVPALGVLKDKTNSNQEAWMTSRMSSYTSTDPFLSAVARETPSPPPLPSTQPLRHKTSLLRKPLARHLTPDRVYSAIMRRIQSRDVDTVSQVSPVTAETPATIIQRQQHTVPRRSPLTQCNLTDLNINEVAARQLSESSDMSFNFSISSRDLGREPNAFSTIRIVNTELRATAAGAFERQHPATIPTENTNSQNPLGRSDRLNRFCSTASTVSVATALPPPPTEIETPLAVTPQNTGDTAASWASANPFRSHTREISSLFPYYGVTRRATSTTTSETTPLRFRQWQYGNVPDSPQALHINPNEDTVIFRGGTASISHSRAASEVRAGETEQAARIVERTLRDSISDAVDMQFGAAW
ncbi:hypothetical protein V1520DRAFT_335221 [Lipomyces starkeyi]